jgi:hypothetical protein
MYSCAGNRPDRDTGDRAGGRFGKYPDLKGQWDRIGPPNKWRQLAGPPPLTPKYQKVFDASLADQRAGKPGNWPSTFCNPILQPWMIPSMKKANDEVLAGKVPFRTRERCWPVGVPGFNAYSLVEPYYFYQTAAEVVVINQGGPEIRHRAPLRCPGAPCSDGAASKTYRSRRPSATKTMAISSATGWCRCLRPPSLIFDFRRQALEDSSVTENSNEIQKDPEDLYGA